MQLQSHARPTPEPAVPASVQRTSWSFEVPHYVSNMREATGKMVTAIEAALPVKGQVESIYAKDGFPNAKSGAAGWFEGPTGDAQAAAAYLLSAVNDWVEQG